MIINWFGITEGMQTTVLRVTTHWLLYSVAKVSCLLLSLHTFWVVLSVCLGSRGPKLKKNNFWRSCCHHLLEKLLRQQAGIAGWAASSDGSNLVPRSYQDKKPVLLALELSSPQPTVELDVRKKIGDDHDIGLSSSPYNPTVLQAYSYFYYWIYSNSRRPPQKQWYSSTELPRQDAAS